MHSVALHTAKHDSCIVHCHSADPILREIICSALPFAIALPITGWPRRANLKLRKWRQTGLARKQNWRCYMKVLLQRLFAFNLLCKNSTRTRHNACSAKTSNTYWLATFRAVRNLKRVYLALKPALAVLVLKRTLWGTVKLIINLLVLMYLHWNWILKQQYIHIKAIVCRISSTLSEIKQ